MGFRFLAWCCYFTVAFLSGECQEPPFPPGISSVTKLFRADDLVISQQLKSGGNKVEQCPCVTKPGSNQCITYDPRYQAATLSEAIGNFPDLTFKELSAVDRTSPQRSLAGRSSLKCTSSSCRRCGAALAERLEAQGAIDQSEMSTVLADLGISSTDRKQKSACKQFRFNRRFRKARPPDENSIPSELRAPLKLLKAKGLQRWRLRTADGFVSKIPRPFIRARQGGSRRLFGIRHRGSGRPLTRPKRSTSDLGVLHTINCVERGEPEDDEDESEDDEDALAICAMCWAWRQLPNDYFPTYLNELICDDDKRCLSGWASCKQRNRNLSVLRNLGTESSPQWEATTISAGACCDCRVGSGSVLHDLVVK